MRKAMGLIQAIMIILVVSGMMLIVLKYASISSRHVADTYVKEQNQLFLQSAIEQTLLAISLHPRANNDCLTSPTITPKSPRGITYSANVDIKKYYLQYDTDPNSDYQLCNGTTNLEVVGIKQSSDISHGMALLEVTSTATKDAGTSDATVVSRILKRTLQQP